jgi:hypothetical protein
MNHKIENKLKKFNFMRRNMVKPRKKVGDTNNKI